jgi:hypothetical protein
VSDVVGSVRFIVTADASRLRPDLVTAADKAGKDAGAQLGRGLTTAADAAGKTVSKTLGDRLGDLSKASAVVTGVLVLAAKQGLEARLSQSRLERAITNTGGAYKDYEGQIKKTIDQQARYGISAQQVRDNVSTLTLRLRDPAKALAAVSLATDIARAKNVDYATAIGITTRLVAGNARAFAAFGINLRDAKTAQEGLKTATKNHADAMATLQSATRRVASQEADLTDKTVALGRASRSVAEAQHSQAQAQQRLDAILAGGPVNAADVQEAQQSLETSSRTLTSAQQDLVAAQEELNNAQKGSSQEELTKAQLAVSEATVALARAQQDLVAAQEDGQSSALDISEATNRVTASQLGLVDAQDELKTIQAAGAQGSDAVVTAQKRVDAAQQSVTDATQAQSRAAEELRKAEAGDPEFLNKVSEARYEVARAIDAVKDSQDNFSRATRLSQRAQGDLLISNALVVRAQADLATANAVLVTAQDRASEAVRGTDLALARVRTQVQGFADDQARTLIGRVQAIRTEFGNVKEELEARFGPALATAGIALTGSTGIASQFNTAALAAEHLARGFRGIKKATDAAKESFGTTGIGAAALAAGPLAVAIAAGVVLGVVINRVIEALDPGLNRAIGRVGLAIVDFEVKAVDVLFDKLLRLGGAFTDLFLGLRHLDFGPVFDFFGRLGKSISDVIENITDFIKKLAKLPGSSFLGFAQGGRTPASDFPLPGRFFAEGGSTPAFRPFVVGERGPEVLAFPRSGQVFTNADLRGAISAAPRGGASSVLVPVNITATFNGPADASSVTAAMQSVVRTEMTAVLQKVLERAAAA